MKLHFIRCVVSNVLGREHILFNVKLPGQKLSGAGQVNFDEFQHNVPNALSGVFRSSVMKFLRFVAFENLSGTAFANLHI